MTFRDRHHAGELLAEELSSWSGKPAFVLGLARGGVIVAGEIAQALHLPLDVLVIRKIPSPMQPELAIGALAPDGVSVIHWRMAQRAGADEDYINTVTQRLSREIRERIHTYRGNRPPPAVKGKNVVVVDDGAATGSTLEAAVLWLRKKKARSITVALPVAPPTVVTALTPEVKKLIILHTASDMEAVGQYYTKFIQVTDEEVKAVLRNHR